MTNDQRSLKLAPHNEVSAHPSACTPLARCQVCRDSRGTAHAERPHVDATSRLYNPANYRS